MTDRAGRSTYPPQHVRPTRARPVRPGLDSGPHRSHVSWGAANVLEVWIAETRMEAERQAAKRMLLATWVLALATMGLVAATVGLIVVSVGE
jgi:hypothetical protein